jgi:hypothetical protein
MVAIEAAVLGVFICAKPASIGGENATATALVDVLEAAESTVSLTMFVAELPAHNFKLMLELDLQTDADA